MGGPVRAGDDLYERMPSVAHRPFDRTYAFVDCPQITNCYRAYRDHWSIQDRKLATFYYDCEFIRLETGRDCPIARELAQGSIPDLYNKETLWELHRKRVLHEEGN